MFWLFLLDLAFRVPLQRVLATANWDRAWRSGEKHRAVWVGSGRPHDWQRPLPIMAAGGNNDGSGRCQPVFTPYPHSLVVDAKKGTVEKTVAFFEDSRRFQRLFSRTARHKTGVSFCFFSRLFVPLAIAEGTVARERKEKQAFLLLFSRLFVPLTIAEGTLARKTKRGLDF